MEMGRSSIRNVDMSASFKDFPHQPKIGKPMALTVEKTGVKREQALKEKGVVLDLREALDKRRWKKRGYMRGEAYYLPISKTKKKRTTANDCEEKSDIS